MRYISILYLILLLGCNHSINGSVSDEHLGCTDSSACNYNADANLDDGSCNYNDCLLSSCNVDVCIAITNVDLDVGNLNIVMINTVPVAGFQFNVDGISISNASGGTAATSGFAVSSSQNTVIAFSFAGTTIPSGNSILTKITFTNYNGPVCIKSPIFSNTSGNKLEVQLEDCYN